MGAPQLQGRAIERGGRTYFLGAVPFGTGNIGELHIAMEGEWQGHPAGAFALTSDVFDAMVERFNAQANPVPIDYEHRSFAADPDTTAAGWIQKLEKRKGESGYELWAVVEWTASAAKMIRSGEYKYCSPAFSLTSKDRMTGEEAGPALKNVALTNLPFLDGQSPIRLSFVCAVSAAAEPEPPSEPAAAPPSTQPQQQPPAAAPPPAPQQAEQDQARVMNEMLAAFVDAIGTTAGIDRAAVVAALNEMDIADEIAGRVREHLDADGMPAEKDMTTKEPPKDKPAAESDDDKAAKIEARAKEVETTMLLSRVTEMRTELDALKAERQAEKDAAVKARIDSMVAEGRIEEKEREDATWTCSNKPEMFERLYASRTGTSKPVPIGVQQAGSEQRAPSSGAEAELQDNERGVYAFLCRQGGYTPEKAMQTIVKRRSQAAKAG